MNSEIDYSATSPQYLFLSDDLASASANPNYDFIIGLVHRPFYSSGYHGREEEMADVLEPLLIANNVDLVIQGHDHMYERIHPQEGVNYIVTGGGGAPPSPIFYWFDWSAFGYNLYHHLDCHYDASEARLSIYMHNYSDNIVDSLILEGAPVSIKTSHKPEIKTCMVCPNPFNSSCVISIPTSRCAGIFDLDGRVVKHVEPGLKSFEWEPEPNVASGIYFVRYFLENKYESKRIVYMK